MKLFETTQGILLSHPVKVVESVDADRDLSKKCHRQEGNQKQGETGLAFTCHQVALRTLKSLFEVQLGILPFTFSALCETLKIDHFSVNCYRYSSFWRYLFNLCGVY